MSPMLLLSTEASMAMILSPSVWLPSSSDIMRRLAVQPAPELAQSTIMSSQPESRCIRAWLSERVRSFGQYRSILIHRLEIRPWNCWQILKVPSKSACLSMRLITQAASSLSALISLFSPSSITSQAVLYATGSINSSHSATAATSRIDSAPPIQSMMQSLSFLDRNLTVSWRVLSSCSQQEVHSWICWQLYCLTMAIRTSFMVSVISLSQRYNCSEQNFQHLVCASSGACTTSYLQSQRASERGGLARTGAISSIRSSREGSLWVEFMHCATSGMVVNSNSHSFLNRALFLSTSLLRISFRNCCSLDCTLYILCIQAGLVSPPYTQSQ